MYTITLFYAYMYLSNHCIELFWLPTMYCWSLDNKSYKSLKKSTTNVLVNAILVINGLQNRDVMDNIISPYKPINISLLDTNNTSKHINISSQSNQQRKLYYYMLENLSHMCPYNQLPKYEVSHVYHVSIAVWQLLLRSQVYKDGVLL